MAEIWFYILVGFVAQLVDGALGMAYGLIATSLLLSMGVTPATASATVHAAEVFRPVSRLSRIIISATSTRHYFAVCCCRG